MGINTGLVVVGEVGSDLHLEYSALGDAIKEALTNYNQALKWAQPGGATNQQLIHLYRRRGRALELLLRHNDALETYQTLETLGQRRRDDSLPLAGISAQALEYWFGHSEYEKGRRRAEEALTLARQLGDRYTESRSLTCSEPPSLKLGESSRNSVFSNQNPDRDS